MHYIQTHILDKLVHTAKLRYRDMRPPHVESNLYNYHLLQLQRDGFIEKTADGYTLTGRGLAYADRHSTSLKKTRSQPKLITVLFVTNVSGQLLLVPKKRQPFMETLNLPSGKIHLQEAVADAAARELQEKVSNQPVFGELSHFGVAHFTIMQHDFVISDYIALLLHTSASTTNLPEGADFYDPQQVSGLPLMPSVAELIEAFLARRQFSEAVIVL